MEVVFCSDRKLSGCEILLIMNELRCPAVKLDGYFTRAEEGSDEEDLIEYQIADCPGMSEVNMNEKMNRVIVAFIEASTKAIGKARIPQWIHLYFGVQKKFLAYCSWHPNRYFNNKQYEAIL